jgi:dihydrofolate reductase
VTQRKIVVYIATSADGYIARPDGNVDWLNRPNTAGDYGMSDFFKTVDTVLWGRRTFDEAMGRTKGKGGFSKSMKTYVFTHNPPSDSDYKYVQFVNEPISEFGSRLRATPGKNIWMMGGGGIIGSFLDAGELDEFIIHVMPVFIGEGIPLIQPRHLQTELKLLSSKSYEDGVVRLHYEVDRAKPTKKGGRKRK